MQYMDELANLAKVLFFLTFSIYCLLAGLVGAIFSLVKEKDKSIISSIVALLYLVASVISYRLMLHFFYAL